jgi:hypothetical protein
LTPAANLPPVSLTPVPNLPPVSTTQGELVAKFATGVVDTCGAPWLANISANFRKNLKWSLCYYQRLGGRWFMKKTWSKKSCDTVPLRSLIYVLKYGSLPVGLLNVIKVHIHLHMITILLSWVVSLLKNNKNIQFLGRKIQKHHAQQKLFA